MQPHQLLFALFVLIFNFLCFNFSLFKLVSSASKGPESCPNISKLRVPHDLARLTGLRFEFGATSLLAELHTFPKGVACSFLAKMRPGRSREPDF